MSKYISETDELLREKYRAENKAYVERLKMCLSRVPIAQIITFGCQQNEADSQIIAGEFKSYGYDIIMGENEKLIPDLIIMNTCAVREHAELKALSKTGNLKAKKKANPELITGIGGCMVQQDHRLNDIKNSYPYVDFLFGTNSLVHLAEIFNKVISSDKRVFHIEDGDGYLPEGMDVYRENVSKAYVSIMYGCNNFCTYCVVPYVRGRERSREKSRILDEIRELVSKGSKEITLLGQNVNSYGKDLVPSVTFAELCNEICAIEGDFTVRFMTSHPKDVSDELIDCVAKNKKMAKHIHFPIQSGSDAMLKAMNRRYTFAEYYEKVEKIRRAVPEVVLSSDIIVGFPGETDEDFQKTLEALEKIRYDHVYSFIYSRRKGTPAASYNEQIDDETKNTRMRKLLDLQTKIMADINSNMVGKTVKASVDGLSKKTDEYLSARTDGNKLVHFKSDKKFQSGDIVYLKITKAMSYQMYGEIVEKEKVK